MVDLQEIQKGLPDANDEQVQRFAEQLERLEKLQNFFKTYPEDREQYQEMLARAEKALNYQRPYRIAVIGTTGVGKSTMLNAMLGRDLVLMREGKPATGAALEIFLDVPEAGREFATVEYRDEANIRQLIQQFLKRYQITNPAILSGKLDAVCAESLERLEPNNIGDGQAFNDFSSLRKTLVNLIMQYSEARTDLVQPEVYYLDQDSDCRKLLELIDENSQLNDQKRRVGLIKSVTYHIKPQQSSNGVASLRLPNNVCLVDFPGLGGSPLHDIIISEGVKDVDAVLFILRPTRLLVRDETYLLHRIRDYVGLEGNLQAAERIFVVLNARDSMMADKPSADLPRNMAELIDLLVPGYATYPGVAKRGGDQPYFMTSAWAAYYAQKMIQDGQVKDPDTYEATKKRLGLEGKSDLEVLIASQVPKLVEELTKFARERRIEGQISEGTIAINRIVGSHYQECERQRQQLVLETGVYSAQTLLKKVVEKKQQDLVYLVSQFHQSLLERRATWQDLLIQDVKRICNETDDVLKEKTLAAWENAFNPSRHKTSARFYGHIADEQVLGDVEFALWHQLAFRFPTLTTHLIQLYTDAIETFMLPQRIEDCCLGAVDVTEVRVSLNQWIDQGMYQKMMQVAERIALTVVTDSKAQFLPPSGITSESKLLQTCKQIPRQPKIANSSELVPLLKAIREHYEPIVSGFCVTALLNLYHYELLLIEDKLLNSFNEILEQLPQSTDPNVQARIDAQISADPTWGRMTLLERKLLILKALQSWKSQAD